MPQVKLQSSPVVRTGAPILMPSTNHSAWAARGVMLAAKAIVVVAELRTVYGALSAGAVGRSVRTDGAKAEPGLLITAAWSTATRRPRFSH